MASDGYRHAGDVEVESATLILSNQQVIDISELVAETNIYQDLFNHYIEADFVMNDSFNLFAQGCSGTEIVEISFRNKVGPEASPQPEFIRHVFFVYEITDKQRISEFKEAYIMNCVSFERYQTIPEKISRSYGPSSIKDMVQKINSEFIYNDSAKTFYRELSKITNYTKTKEGIFDETSGQFQYVIPNMVIDDAIDFLSSESDSSDHIPFYTFYEDANGFNFRNISNLISQPIAATYHHLPTKTDALERDAINDRQNDSAQNFDDTFKIISYNVVKQNNILQNTNSGMYKSKSIDIDIHRRKANISTFDYGKYSDKFKFIQNKILGGSDGSPVVSLGTSRKGHESDKLLSVENHLPKRTDQTKPITDSYKRSIFNVVMEVIVPGSDTIIIGQMIELMFYRTIGDEVRLDEYDKYLSGKYLITKVRQKLTGAKTGVDYVTVIECTRDGIKED